jgi:hypothetical protein
VVNRTLSAMLHAILRTNLKMWEECLPHIEFTYNRSMHSTSKKCSFQIVYGFIPRAPIDLLSNAPMEDTNCAAHQCDDLIHKIHAQTRGNIEHMNAKYHIAGSNGRKEISFEPGDLVWLHLRKDWFLALRKSKLMTRADGPFTVLEKINDNACKLNLPKEYGVSPTFNVTELKHYVGEEEQILSRMISLQEGEDDEHMTPADSSTTPTSSTTPAMTQGPMT